MVKCACWALESGHFGEEMGFVPSDEPFLSQKSVFFRRQRFFQGKKTRISPQNVALRSSKTPILAEKGAFSVETGTSEAQKGIFGPQQTVFKRRWGVRRGMEGCALGARPSPAAAACQTALQAACPHAVHGMEPMRGGGLENPPSFSWRTAVERLRLLGRQGRGVCPPSFSPKNGS